MSWEPLTPEPPSPGPGEPPSPADSGESTVPGSGFTSAAEDSSYQAWPPAARRPATRASRRRMAGLVAAVAAGSLLLAALCAGALTYTVRAADPDRVTQPTDPPTAAQPSVSPFSGIYVAPFKLCPVADFTPLRPLFRSFQNFGSDTTTDPRTGATVLACDATVGNDTASGALHMVVRVYPDSAAAARDFEEGRDPAAVEAPDVGTAAYVVDGAEGGREIRALDFNLTIALAWRSTEGGQLDQAALDRTLAATCRSTVKVLRFA